jgi:hypothetical protein
MTATKMDEDMKLFSALLIPGLALFGESLLAESSIQYHYGTLKVDYESYTGARRSLDMRIQEFSIVDASGEFSAGLSNISSRYAAEQGAVAEEKRKVREGESAPGTKIISYSWQERAAAEGDAKRYGLRLGSTESIFSLDPITGSDANKFSSLAEFSLIGALDTDVLWAADSFLLRHDLYWGFRLGFFRDFDLTSPLRVSSIDRKFDTGYFYLPFSYRVSLILPFGLTGYGEAGIDPITMVRHQFSDDNQKIPHDIVLTSGVEYRALSIMSVGWRMEEYRGSSVVSTEYQIHNPEYRQKMVTFYINFSE